MIHDTKEEQQKISSELGERYKEYSERPFTSNLIVYQQPRSSS